MNTFNTYAEAKKEITAENFNRLNIKKWIKNYSHKELVEICVFSAELVIDLYEGSSDAPKQSIQSAKDWLLNPSKENEQKCKDAYAAAYATYTAAAAAYADDAATYTAAAADACAVKASVKEKIINYILSKYEQTETPEEKEAFEVMAQDNEAVKSKVAVSECNPFVDQLKKINEYIGKFSLSPNATECSVEITQNILDTVGDMSSDEEISKLMQQPKPKHTKEGYPRVTESIFELKGEYERGELYSNYVSDKGIGYDLVESEESLTFNYSNNSLHRKVVTELTEKEAFIEHTKGIVDLIKDGMHTSEDVADLLFEANCRLVEGE